MFSCCEHLSSFTLISKTVVVPVTTFEQERPPGLVTAFLRERELEREGSIIINTVIKLNMAISLFIASILHN